MLAFTRRLEFIPLVGLLAGCSGSDDSLDAAGAPPKENSRHVAAASRIAYPGTYSPPRPIFLVHDFGSVFDDCRILHHSFRLTNSTRAPVHALKAVPLTPCCCAVGPLPGEIPAASSAEVSASLKLGLNPGLVRAEALIVASSTGLTVWSLELRANVVAKREIRPAEPAEEYTLSTGCAGRWIWRVTTRCAPDEAPAAPITVRATEPLRVSFLGPSSVPLLSHGVRESTRDIEVLAPATARPFGRQHGEIVVWFDRDQALLKHRISWHVVPVLRAVPSGFVLTGADGPVSKSVLVESDDRPFRIIGINNPFATDSASPGSCGAFRSHRIELDIDPARTERQRVGSIRIITDHPSQPEVTVSVLILPGPTGDNR